MNGTSYLLALDGSAESRTAAHFAWELAAQTGASVVAQHVIDTAAAWQFLSYDRPGFIGSGVYMEAREQISSALRSIAEALMLSYCTQVQGRSITAKSHIDEGDPACEIVRRAADHDLVIIGHRSGPRQERLYETLVKTCPCPVLVVGGSALQWSKVQMFVTDEIASAKSMQGIYHLGTALGLISEVYIDAKADQTDSEDLTLGGWSSAFGVRLFEHSTLKKLIETAPDDVLLVVPSELTSGYFGSRYRVLLRTFLGSSQRRALLFWREKAAAENSLISSPAA
jgi:nucleotide-binding universal stress UspA family protein